MTNLQARALAPMILLACLLLGGCVTSAKYRMAPEDTPPAVPLNISAESAALDVKLATVIVYQGPGSWKQDALWDEYVVSLSNRSAATLIVDSARLVDPLGEKQSPGIDPWALERLSEANWKNYAKVGLYVLGVGVAGQTLGLGLYALGFGGGATAAYFVALPLALLANVTVVGVMNHRNKFNVQAEFDRRRLVLPLALRPGATSQGSLFFPIVPTPQRLILQGMSGDVPMELVLDLKPLAGLHVKPPAK